MADRLATGIPALDRKLDGGLPRGGLSTLTAAPDSQSELLLSQLAIGQETAYISTERPASSVRTAMEDNGVNAADLTIYDVSCETPILDSIRYVREYVDQDLVVVDPVDVLEAAGHDQYREFLAELGNRMETTGGTAVLYGLVGGAIPAGRTLTTYMADVVLNLETTVEDESIRNRLTVPKFRGGAAFDESLRLELTERVGVDTSRDIA